MTESEILTKANKQIITICIIALTSISLVAIVALLAMSAQSQHAMDSGVKAFELYMTSDYDYGTITQSTDIKVGE